MRTLAMMILLIANAIFCNISALAQALIEGDLLFQLGAASPMDDAITASTDHGEGQVVHVGILAMIDGVPSVIEAVPESGVSVTALTVFIANSRVAHAVPCIKVMRAEGVDARSAIDRALAYVGLPYDNAFLPGDDALYCSELVYECYLNADGTHIFEAAPMNFLAPDGSLPAYWQNHYARLGIEVPQGVPGTNPAAISTSPKLTHVLSF